jgi:hypothetical protein
MLETLALWRMGMHQAGVERGSCGVRTRTNMPT